MPKKETIERILVTGAAGALGRELTRALIDAGYLVRAMIHKTPLNIPGVESIRGNISDFPFVLKAMKGMDAVCQLATTKEDPASFFDVSLRGTYNLLEAARRLGSIKRWILTGGDAAMGIYYYPQPGPINENMPHRAYPGVYAFSKVIEEVMGEQYKIQYGLPYVCLRASWIMHDDMIFRTLRKNDCVAILVHPDGKPLIRHVVGINDVVAAFILALKNPASAGQTFNIAAASAFSYDVAGEYLAKKTGMSIAKIKVPEAHDFQIDISKARGILGYDPKHDIFSIIDAALKFQSNKARRHEGT